MSGYVVSLNGRLVPESQAHLSIWDRGFTLGDAVFDTARTFRHRPFQLDRHLTRLFRSLRYVNIDPGNSEVEMKEEVERVLQANIHHLAPDDDMLLTIRVSRGGRGTHPTVLITGRPIAFG